MEHCNWRTVTVFIDNGIIINTPCTAPFYVYVVSSSTHYTCLVLASKLRKMNTCKLLHFHSSRVEVSILLGCGTVWLVPDILIWCKGRIFKSQNTKIEKTILSSQNLITNNPVTQSHIPEEWRYEHEHKLTSKILTLTCLIHEWDPIPIQQNDC
jgi:hypothetical protein